MCSGILEDIKASEHNLMSATQRLLSCSWLGTIYISDDVDGDGILDFYAMKSDGSLGGQVRLP